MPVGPTELIIILVIVLLLFGAKRIPELAKGLGTGMKEFKKGASGEDDELEKKKEKDEQLDKAEEEKVGSRMENASADVKDEEPKATPEAEHAEQKRS